ncbi:methyl-accepting chemotaxis protein [Ideonella sp. BN130291]|uniref:methyl-accepting chemotaxis protein n=1 Tax=Ideonella sp. BN130291 TaxID=3112940 RepID=UPI002E25A82C|nr:methyl-accepting chemotaxis protein [Ideonella sp. BN130291]
MDWFRRITVGQRLALGFGTSLALLLLMAGGAWWVLSSVKQGVDVIVGENNKKTDLAWRMRAELDGIAQSVRTLIVTRNTDVQNAQKDAQAASRKRFDDSYAALGKLIANDPEEKKLYATIGQMRTVVLPLFDESIEQAQRGMKETAAETLIDKVQKPQTEWFAAMQALIDLQTKRTADRVSGMNAGYAAAAVGLAGGALLAVALAAALGAAITRSLTRQLGGEPTYAREVARRIAAGDLGEQIRLRSHDNSSLLAAMHEMQQGLRSMVRDIQQSAESVATASQEIARGNLDLSSRTEQQASSLQETSASMTQLTGTVRQNTSSARQASELAASASEVAAQGGEAVNEVVRRMEEIQASSKRITEIIGVIDGIAFQTNILALNAAVEAARAGEQGRGFAVVAGEVRNLAQRSAQAAKEIKTLISDSVERVEGGSKLVSEAGSTMQDIVQRVRQVSTLVNEITHASVEQESGIGQIGTAVTDLDNMTQQNAALVEQSTAAAESLKSQAARLTDTVSQFRIAA